MFDKAIIHQNQVQMSIQSKDKKVIQIFNTIQHGEVKVNDISPPERVKAEKKPRGLFLPTL